MQRKQDGVIPIHDTSPQARHHFTQADQVNQLVEASEADADLGFMARLMALCSLPRSNPGDRHQYQRVNGPYKLILSRTGEYKLPFGNLPRLLLAWISTEAVRTQSRDLILWDSLSEFMRTLGVYSSAGGGANAAPQPDESAFSFQRRVHSGTRTGEPLRCLTRC